MRLILENIGMLKKADMTLHQLSVIAGENDNGKSTVGKVVFCIVKAINRYKEDLQESKEHKTHQKLQELFFVLRRAAPDYNKQVEVAFHKLKDFAISELPFTKESESFKEAAEEIKYASKIENPEQLKRVEQLLNDIYDVGTTPEVKSKSITNALTKVFASEFDSSVLLLGESEGSIKLYENRIKLLHIKITSENKFSLESEVEPIELKDATFIESPLILNNHDLLIRSQSGLNHKGRLSRLGLPYTTLHTKDLFDKLREPSFEDLFASDDDKSFKEELFKIINGEVNYDDKSKDFSFEKNMGSISIKNTASGIKVFGILQLLLNNGFINKNTLLVFDEPENHLHPKWQLKLAEVLVNLSSRGVYVLVSSHSPYMIEALQRYSEMSGMEDSSEFYLAENNSIENEGKLEKIFIKLSEPFEVFRDMDRELLKDE